MDRSDWRGAQALLTVGHSNHPIERFIELIAGAGIETIVDVRSAPFSRFAPQFNKAALAKSLAAAHIGYRYLGNLLGGRPGGGPDGVHLTWEEAASRESFREGMDTLLALCLAGRCAVMCAEKDPNRCHRTHLIGAAVMAARGNVIHLLGDGTLVPEEPRLPHSPAA